MGLLNLWEQEKRRETVRRRTIRARERYERLKIISSSS
jgi:hypothetical protein